jgi:hypothetical protein
MEKERIILMTGCTSICLEIYHFPYMEVAVKTNKDYKILHKWWGIS